ncbi:MAG: hypothetical protein J6X56_03290 [Ruminococcus sp.]|nr:hypothetical protein [Ruminococcus sp.]
MFRKVHDRMFRRAQMKLFGMIVSILLAVFIALIFGINMITESVMNMQSKEVLEEIAADIGYDERKATFYFVSHSEPKNEREAPPPSKPSNPSDPSTTAETDTTAEGTDAATSSDVPANTDAPTEGEVTEPEDQPSVDPDTQPAEPDTTTRPWVIFPTMPEDATFPDMSGGWNQDWNKQDGSSDGQNWNQGWNSGAWGGQDWNNQGGSTGSQGWSGGWGNQDWNNQGGSSGGQDWSGGWGSQDWNNQGGSSGGQDWSGGWGSQDWNSGGWGGQDWNSQSMNGWYWDGKQWKNNNGETWDGTGIPPWIEVSPEQEEKYSQWWSSSNPYNLWDPNNPYSPWNKKVKDSESSAPPKANSNEPEEVKEEFKRYSSEQDTADPDDIIAQTSEDGSGYELVLLSESGTSGTAARTVNTGNQNSAKNAAKVEEIPRKIGFVDYFALMADTNGKYLNQLYTDIDVARAQKYTSIIINDRHDTGIINVKRDTGLVDSYQYYKASKPNGTIMILTDNSYETNVLKQLKRTTIMVGFIAMVVLSVFAYFLSKKSIQPIKTAFDKQKQFVSDASHELKTPLTVISTNADVLEGEIGDNKWLNYIKSQTDRMSVLVNDLLNLTRLENSNNELERRYFNLSKAIANTALPFECQAFESNKKFEVNIEDNIMLNGSEKHIKQMAAIFIDNALKYSNAGGTIQVTLKRSGERKLFSVFNTGEGIKETDTEKIFERFYRSDESRNRATGGYGLGLAIAKSVADKHKFKIHVLNQPGKGVCFIVTM